MIFLLLFLYSAGESLGPPRCCKWPLFIMFSGCVVFHARHVPHLPCLFLCRWTAHLHILALADSAAVNTAACLSFWIVFSPDVCS